MNKFILYCLLLCNIHYANSSELKRDEELFLTQDKINKTVDASVIKSYEKINKNWNYALNSNSLKTDSKFWEIKVVTVHSHNGAVKCPGLFWLSHNNENLGKAITDIQSSSSQLECFNASRMTKVRAITDLIGDKKTRKLISKINQSTSITDYDFFKQLSWSFQTQCTEDFKGVYFIGFANIPAYTKYKPEGDAQAHNVIKLSNGKFLGFCPKFFTHPRTYNEVEEHMYNLFVNEEFVPESLKNEHKQYCRILNFEMYKLMRRTQQSKFPPYTFDVEKLNEFLKSN